MLIGNWMTGNEEDPDMMSPRPIRYAAVCTKSSSLFSHAQCGGKINPADCELASTWLDKLGARESTQLQFVEYYLVRLQTLMGLES